VDALADAAGLPRKDVRLAQIFPELFHCSGFALMGRATANGELFHGRILDYMTEIGFQKHAVTFICMPEGKHAFVNVGFAGYLGSVTGMNDQKVAFGEMGGRGEGHWDGEPMGFLVRRGMEEAETLQQAIEIFRKAARTCEYYYVISDGKTRDAVGLKCRPDLFEVVRPGEAHPEIPAALPDTVIFSAGDRYPELVKRVKAGYGKIEADSAIELMKQPVAMHSNLHCVLFAPERLVCWVAIAADPSAIADYQACDQHYVRIDLGEWMERCASLSKAADAPQRPAETTVLETPAKLAGTGNDAARPQIAPDPDAEMSVLLNQYRLPAQQFAWSGALRANMARYAIYDVQFPSPVESAYPQNNTVYAEYYRTSGTRERPAVVVLDIADGSLVVARIVATGLASSGTDALVVNLPFHGPRRPQNVEAVPSDPELFKKFSVQGVADVRRACALLAGLKEVAPGQIGICGVSLGGFVGALAAGVDGNFKRCAFVLAGGNLQEVLTSGAREVAGIRPALAEAGLVGPKLADFLRPIDPVTFAPRLRSCNVLMLNMKGDEVVPAASAEALARAAGVKDIIWYDGPNHGAMVNHILDVLARLESHFKPGWN
jgi:dienelactone hydrolase